MKTWVISDTHFYHEKLKENNYRPQDFMGKIICNWKRMVSDDDLVIHLGDVSWSKDLLVDTLPGRKVLVRGNHDKKTCSWYMSHGFDFACDSFDRKFGNVVVRFTHVPIEKPDYTFDINIHGHLHTRELEKVWWRHLISLENNGYTLENVADIVPKFNKGEWC